MSKQVLYENQCFRQYYFRPIILKTKMKLVHIPPLLKHPSTKSRTCSRSEKVSQVLDST